MCRHRVALCSSRLMNIVLAFWGSMLNFLLKKILKSCMMLKFVHSIIAVQDLRFLTELDRASGDSLSIMHWLQRYTTTSFSLNFIRFMFCT